MPKYKKVDVPEQKLEDLIRQNADLIEDGLVYLDHQRQAASGRLDLLMVDSGHALVVAELKVVEDDGMLLQGLDYYDYVTTNIEAYARVYKEHAIDAVQTPRLILVAPSFSQTLINRCKWIDVPISLFTYTCLLFGNSEEVTPVFAEQAIPSPLDTITVFKLEDRLKYITDTEANHSAVTLMDEIKQWKPGRISLDALKYYISLKLDGRVFAYIHPRRKHYVVSAYDSENKWTDFPIKNAEERKAIIPVVKESMERNSAK